MAPAAAFLDDCEANLKLASMDVLLMATPSGDPYDAF